MGASPTPPEPDLDSRPSEPLLTLLLSLFISILAFLLVNHLVPKLGPHLVSKGLSGRDMLKPGFKHKLPPEIQHDSEVEGQGEAAHQVRGELLPGQKPIPEATGVIAASVYILLLSLFAPLPYLSHLLPSSSSLPANQITPEAGLQFPHHSFATYLASLLSLLIATFLGFCDDVFDIRWRWKLPIPLIASVPLLVTYAAGHGVTDIVLPDIFGIRELLGAVATNGVVRLGPLYYIYMSMLSTFCTNSINILAGVNGVEVSQSLLISLSLLLNDLLYLTFDLRPLLPLLSHLPPPLTSFLEPWFAQPWTAGFANGSKELADRHAFSLYFMGPLVGVCAGLLRWNWYPSLTFPGDTFCYFTGMTFAVTSILSHYSKTLVLFFLPQLFNFLYSCPQLFGLVDCPRHRLPRFTEHTGRLEPSWAVVHPRAQRSVRQTVGVGLLVVAEKLSLVKLGRDSTTLEITSTTNLTLLNFLLLKFGSMREDRLTRLVMGIQGLGSLIAFGVRYGGAGWFYGDERR